MMDTAHSCRSKPDRGSMASPRKAASQTGQLVRHLTVGEREKLGKDARTRASRSSQAEFRPGIDRPDPVSLLEHQAASRIPELVPIRYGRMLVSPFTFFRGAALIMAVGLGLHPPVGA